MEPEVRVGQIYRYRGAKGLQFHKVVRVRPNDFGTGYKVHCVDMNGKISIKDSEVYTKPTSQYILCPPDANWNMILFEEKRRKQLEELEFYGTQILEAFRVPVSPFFDCASLYGAMNMTNKTNKGRDEKVETILCNSLTKRLDAAEKDFNSKMKLEDMSHKSRVCVITQEFEALTASIHKEEKEKMDNLNKFLDDLKSKIIMSTDYDIKTVNTPSNILLGLSTTEITIKLTGGIS